MKQLQSEEIRQQWPVYLQSFSDVQTMGSSHPLLKLSYRQLGRGQFHGEFFGFPLPHGMFWRSKLNLSVEGEGTIPPGYLLMALSVGDQDYWHEQSLSPDSIAIGKDPGGLKHRTGDNHEAWVWLLSHQRYLELTKSLGLEVSNLMDTAHVQTAHREPLERLTDHVADFMDLAQRCGKLESDQVIWFENELIRQTLHCLRGQTEDSAPSEAVNESIAQVVRDFMQERCDQPLCIATLCQELEFSERTLREHFTKYYGISPGAYHLTMRLGRVQRKLSFAKPARGAVSAAATTSGFWHMGRFAKQYKRHFGESPVTTLNRAGRTECSNGWTEMPRSDPYT